jgi:glycosyltransferase involved in cell wall biosynthesis
LAVNTLAKEKPKAVALLAPRMCELGHDACGGSEVLLWEDREILQNAGIPVRVYGRSVRNGAPAVTLRMHSCLPLISSLEYCGRFLFHEDSSIVIGYNEPTLAGLVPDRAVVRFDWATPLPKYWKLPRWKSRFQRGLYLFPSESERRLFLGLHPLIAGDSAVVIPNAVDLRLFRPKQQDVSLRVGFAGQWAPGKGLSDLLDAWSLVRKLLPTAELWLAGSANLWKNASGSAEAQKLAEQVEGLGKEGSVRIVGERNRREMPNFWNSLSVAAVPSLHESFGLVALEALACGIPVVASAVGGLKEIVIDGECGFLVPPHNPGKLASALLRLLNDEPLRRRLAQSARRRAQMFSLECRSEALLSLLDRRWSSTGTSSAPFVDLAERA